jgi:hypothetical protein
LELAEININIAGNDAYDIAHFAYLAPSIVLVTNDKRMQSLAACVGVKSITAEEIALGV